MSKSKGNVVSPEDIIKKYGADTARLFILFASPPEKELEWSDTGVEGSYRFLSRVYRLVHELSDTIKDATDSYVVETSQDRELNYVLNTTIKKVTDDLGNRFNFNTAISAIMVLVNELYRYKSESVLNKELLRYAIKCLILILSPFTPHICEEMWQHIGHDSTLYNERWPEYDEAALVRDETEIAIQINGKVKERIMVTSGLSKDEFLEEALKNDTVKALLDGKNVIKIIPVPDKLLNIVVK
jgi:leucyl-tRNA synthetase